MRMRLEGVKKGLGSSSAPVTIGIAISISATSSGSIPIAIAVAGPAGASEDTIGKTYVAIRSAAIHTAIARVVTVNKLRAFLIHLRDPAAASLTQNFRRDTQDHQQYQ